MYVRLALLLGLFGILAGAAQAQPFDPWLSTAFFDDPHSFTLAPCGADPLPVVEVYLYDFNGDPVQLLASDIWLQGVDLTFCGTLTFADSSTFAPDPGHTTFSGVRHGWALPWRDCADLDALVVALGYTINSLPFHASSPDLNGDGAVTVSDFSLFGQRWQGADACADFNEDGMVALGDFAMFAVWFNHCTCP